MASYEFVIGTLEAELTTVADVFRGLDAGAVAAIDALGAGGPRPAEWTVLELAGHFDIAIGLTRMLIAGQEDAQPARDRTSFFINPRSETGPVVYAYAYTMVEGKTPGDMPGCWPRLHQDHLQARAVPASLVGPGYFAPCGPMSSQPAASWRPWSTASTWPGAGVPYFAAPDGIAATAAILDDLLARRTTGRRPAGLSDDLDWILAASGRPSATTGCR